MSLDLGNMVDSVEQALLGGQGENLGHKKEGKSPRETLDRRHFTQTGKELGNHLIRKEDLKLSKEGTSRSKGTSSSSTSTKTW
jgi:hypothetical protein